MTKRKLLILAGLIIALGSFGISRALAYVIEARVAKYEFSAPCGKLSGFDGLLQAANFVSSGDCEVDLKKGGCHDSRACNISNPASGKSDKGKCTPSADRQSCFCVAK